MPYVENKYQFDIDDFIAEKNAGMRIHFQNVCVILGGVVLPVNTVYPKKFISEIKTRNWLSKEELGKKRKKITEKINSDGTVTKLEEVTYFKEDNSRVTESFEQTFDPNYDYYIVNGMNPFSSLSEFFDKLKPRKRGSSTVTITNNTPKLYPKINKRKSIVLKQGSDIEDVEETTERFLPLSTDKKVATSETVNWRQVHSSEPKVFAKPKILTSVTGKQFKQIVRGSLSPPEDVNYHNDEMRSTQVNAPTLGNAPNGFKDSRKNRIIIDNQKNEKRTEIFNDRVDPDGNTYLESNITIEPLIDPVELLLDNESKTTTKSHTESKPTEEIAKTEVYDKHGNKITESNRVIKRTPSKETSTSEEISNDGTKNIRSSVKEIDPINGQEIINETETQTRESLSIVTTRSDSYNYDDNTKTVTLTKSTTEKNGDTKVEEKVFRYVISTEIRSVEVIKEDFEDDLVNNLVSGYSIMEFEFTGEVLEDYLIKLLQTKYYEHQRAWVMLDVLEEQLNLGNRISPDLKQKLYDEHLKIFTGNSPVGDPVRGGTVLDRISLEVFGETFPLGCVFAKDNGMDIKWIPGTDKMYSWSIVVRIYNNVIKDSQIINLPESTRTFGFETDILPGDYD